MYKTASKFNNRAANIYISKRLKKNKKDSIKLFDLKPNRLITRKKEKKKEFPPPIISAELEKKYETEIINQNEISYKITNHRNIQNHKRTSIEIAFQKAQEKNISLKEDQKLETVTKRTDASKRTKILGKIDPSLLQKSIYNLKKYRIKTTKLKEKRVFIPSDGSLK